VGSQEESGQLPNSRLISHHAPILPAQESMSDSAVLNNWQLNLPKRLCRNVLWSWISVALNGASIGYGMAGATETQAR
jgi:hypothetical protein